MAQVQGTIVQMHRRGHRHRVPARGDAEGLRRARRSRTRDKHAGREGPDVRSRAAARRRRRAHHRDGLLRRPAARHEGAQHRRADLGAGRPRRARPRHGRARPPDRRARPDRVRTSGASIHQPAPKFDELVAVGRAARDRHQGHRPDLPVRQGRQDRPVRRRRRRQDRQHARADQQHRDAALGPVGVRRRRRAHARRQRLLPRDVGGEGHRAGGPRASRRWRWCSAR